MDISRCDFRPLDRVFIRGDESRIPWVKPPVVPPSRSRTQHWPVYKLEPIESVPEELDHLRGRFSYVFKAIGKKNTARDGGQRWYDRQNDHILLFPVEGHLRFPLGLKSAVHTYSAPVPKYPFFSDYNEQVLLHQASYWMYRVQSPLLTGIHPSPPTLTDLPTRLKAGDSQLTAETEWADTDREDEDDTFPAQNSLLEDVDPVPHYSLQEAAPPPLDVVAHETATIPPPTAMDVDLPVTISGSGVSDPVGDTSPPVDEEPPFGCVPSLVASSSWLSPTLPPLSPSLSPASLRPSPLRASNSVRSEFTRRVMLALQRSDYSKTHERKVRRWLQETSAILEAMGFSNAIRDLGDAFWVGRTALDFADLQCQVIEEV